MGPDLEAELKAATQVAQRKSETLPRYLKRLATAVKKLDDDDWQSLSGEAQKWANRALEAIEEHQDIPSFNGVPVPSPKSPRKDYTKAQPGDRERVYALLLKDPGRTRAELLELLEAEGNPPPMLTISSSRGSFLRVMKFLKSKGLLNIEWK